MSADCELNTEEGYRKQREEQEKARKRAAAEWRKNPVRGMPVSGTGKHRFDNGGGRPVCTLRWRDGRWGGKLIGGRNGYDSVPDWVNDDLGLRRMRGRLDSNEADGTFAGFEEEIDRKLAEEAAFQAGEVVVKARVEIVEVPKAAVVYVNVDPATEEEVAAWQRGVNEGPEIIDEVMGPEDEDEDEDEMDNGQAAHELQVQRLLGDGFKVRDRLPRPLVTTNQMGWSGEYYDRRRREWYEATVFPKYMLALDEQIRSRGEEEFSQV